MVKDDLKKRILSALEDSRRNFTGSDAKFSVSIGINAAQYSRVRRGDTDRVLSDAQWITLARRLGVNPDASTEWKAAETPVFGYIREQLDLCRVSSMSSLLCDVSDIGKTFAAVHYSKRHKNVVYVDCSQVKSRSKLVRYISKEFGLDNGGLYRTVYENLVYYIKTLSNPLIILDEAGDLEYDAFLEIKALWNATEMACGWYMMGADGLREKIRRSIEFKKVGYTEIFSRFGRRFGKFIPIDKSESERLLQTSAAMIIRANAPEGTDIGRLLHKTMGEDNIPSLRRIFKEIAKINKQ
jgi:hypothetical protein